MRERFRAPIRFSLGEHRIPIRRLQLPTECPRDRFRRENRSTARTKGIEPQLERVADHLRATTHVNPQRSRPSKRSVANQCLRRGSSSDHFVWLEFGTCAVNMCAWSQTDV